MPQVSICKCGRAVPSEKLRIAMQTKKRLTCRMCKAVIDLPTAARKLKAALQGVDSAEDPIQAKFDEFDRQHPDVYDLFKKFAWQLRNAGRDRGGAKSIMERIRWELATTSSPEKDGFKINNNFTSRYARKLIEDDPSFGDFFETRRLSTNRDSQ